MDMAMFTDSWQPPSSYYSPGAPVHPPRQQVRYLPLKCLEEEVTCSPQEEPWQPETWPHSPWKRAFSWRRGHAVDWLPEASGVLLTRRRVSPSGFSWPARISCGAGGDPASMDPLAAFAATFQCSPPPPNPCEKIESGNGEGTPSGAIYPVPLPCTPAPGQQQGAMFLACDEGGQVGNM